MLLNVSYLFLNFLDSMSAICIHCLKFDLSNPIFHVCLIWCLQKILLLLSRISDNFKNILFLMFDLLAYWVSKWNIVNSLLDLAIPIVVDHVSNYYKISFWELFISFFFDMQNPFKFKNSFKINTAYAYLSDFPQGLSSLSLTMNSKSVCQTRKWFHPTSGKIIPIEFMHHPLHY